MGRLCQPGSVACQQNLPFKVRLKIDKSEVPPNINIYILVLNINIGTHGNYY